MEKWQLISLETEAPAILIGDYFEKELGYDIKRIGTAKGTVYEKKTDIRNFANRALGEGLERKLTLMGSGQYHHYTYGLSYAPHGTKGR